MKFHFLKVSVFLCLLSKINGAEFFEENSSTSLEENLRLNGITTQEALGAGKSQALDTTVRLLRNQKLIALGTLINPEGYLITKASSCVGAREAILTNGKTYPLKIKKRFEEVDLALYQLQGEGLEFNHVRWDKTKSISEESLVFSAFTELEEIRLGVASGSPRPIGREGGVMGVLLGREGKKLGGVEISEVVPQAAAYRAGLLPNDLIVRVDTRKVTRRDQVIKIVGAKDPGDLVNLEIKRKKLNKSIKVTLGHRSVTFDLFNRNLQMSGPVSKRKDNFPLILQHDLPLPKEAMGGPLFDIKGNFLGVNIARVDRVTVFTLPAETVRTYVEEWVPEKIN